MTMFVTLFFKCRSLVFTLATQTWDKAPHWGGVGVEVFALVNLQIGLLCLQIVIITAPITILYGDSALVLDRKV
jgi:hypothetical protein